MPRQAKSTPKQSEKRPPAKTPEARENQMIGLAVSLAEKQLRDGTASSQIITHYLKLGSTKESLEKEILEKKAELMKAKTDAIKSHAKIEKLYGEALEAMRLYSGAGAVEEEIDDA